jgi:NUMOD4 motif
MGANMIEIWKSIEDFEGRYEVSNLGNVRSMPRPQRPGRGGWARPGVILKAISQHKGYLCVNLSKDGIVERKEIAILVAKAFIPNPLNKPQVNHIKGKEKHNNRTGNLEWATESENTQHAYDTGLTSKSFGEKNHQAKLKDSQIVEIRQRLSAGESRKSLADIFKVSRGLIDLISAGHRTPICV